MIKKQKKDVLEHANIIYFIVNEISYCLLYSKNRKRGNKHDTFKCSKTENNKHSK